MGDEWEICGTNRGGIQNGRYVQHPTSEAICNVIFLTMETGDVKSLNVCHFASRFFWGFLASNVDVRKRISDFELSVRIENHSFAVYLRTTISAILKLE